MGLSLAYSTSALHPLKSDVFFIVVVVVEGKA
jgi:hypothetical protein